MEVIRNNPLHTFYLPDSLSFTDTAQVLKHYDWYGDYDRSNFYQDTTKKQFSVGFVIYGPDKKGEDINIGLFNHKYKQTYYDVKSIYVASSGNDSLRYISTQKQVYEVPRSNWLTGFSFPRVQTAQIIYLPPQEYAAIPKSLIRKLPF